MNACQTVSYLPTNEIAIISADLTGAAAPLCLTGCTFMQQIAFYMLIASLTIATPGPGVLFTLTNTLNYSLRHAMAGIIGVAAGMGVIAIVAASSVGAIITTSQLALLAVKVTGAAYLIYLGSKLFRSVPLC
jgi:threonine/homoserine/homoserine lactone efflux protein